MAEDELQGRVDNVMPPLPEDVFPEEAEKVQAVEEVPATPEESTAAAEVPCSHCGFSSQTQYLVEITEEDTALYNICLRSRTGFQKELHIAKDIPIVIRTLTVAELDEVYQMANSQYENIGAAPGDYPELVGRYRLCAQVVSYGDNTSVPGVSRIRFPARLRGAENSWESLKKEEGSEKPMYQFMWEYAERALYDEAIVYQAARIAVDEFNTLEARLRSRVLNPDF